jgi:hypothetical protein
MTCDPLILMKLEYRMKGILNPKTKIFHFLGPDTIFSFFAVGTAGTQ